MKRKTRIISAITIVLCAVMINVNSFGFIFYLIGSRWQNDGIPICSDIHGKAQENPQIAAIGNGESIIVWEDNTSGNYDIYAQKIDAEGNVLWAQDKVVANSYWHDEKFPQVVADGYGGAIIVWEGQYILNTINGAYDPYVYAQRISKDGVKLWSYQGTSGKRISIHPIDNFQEKPRLVTDGNHGAIVAWQQSCFTGKQYWWRIFTQRLTKDGNRVWGNQGKPVTVDIWNTYKQYNIQTKPRIVADVSGGSVIGAIIVWDDNRWGKYGNNKRIVTAQKINLNGVWQWHQAGRRISPGPEKATTNLLGSNNPRLISDAAGGAVFVWEQEISLGKTYPQYLYARCLNAAGKDKWDPAKSLKVVSLCQKPVIGKSVEIVADGKGGAFVAWSDYRANKTYTYDIYAQKINIANGATVFSANGIKINNGLGGCNPQLIADGTGGAIICWQQMETLTSYYDIYAQSVASNGAQNWISGGVPICDAKDSQKSPALISDGSGGAYITWSDSRNWSSSYYDIYAQRVEAASVLTATISIQSVAGKNKKFKFNSQASFNPDYGNHYAVSYLWSFGNGSTSTKENPTYEYPKPGSYFVTLKVTDNYNQSHTGYKMLTIPDTISPPPSPSPSPTPPSPSPGPNPKGDPYTTWYFAEGYTGKGPFGEQYETWLVIQNPNHVNANLTITCLTDNGTQIPQQVTVKPRRRKTIFLNEIAGLKQGVSVSTKVVSDKPVYMERAMYWSNREGGHNSVGVNTPNTTWYFGEGYTGKGFYGKYYDMYLCILNPNIVDGNVKIEYMTNKGLEMVRNITAKANSRTTIYVNSDLPGLPVSAKITANLPIVAERVMYWGSLIGSSIDRTEGHNSPGLNAPAKTWYLAEGDTSNGHETWITLQNPGSIKANVTLTYMTMAGVQYQKSVAVPAQYRETVFMNDDLLGIQCSTKVDSDQPIIVERSVYWNQLEGGHNSPGSIGAGQTWYLAEGYTGLGFGGEQFETKIPIMNPGNTDAKVTLTYMTKDGDQPPQQISVKAHSRHTVSVNNDLYYLGGVSVSTKITSDQPIVIERSMTWDNNRGGHCSVGIK